MNAVKEFGRVYTPSSIVTLMLNVIGYSGAAVLRKHIMENSCGDGAFLTEIVRRYCSAAVASGRSPLSIRDELETYVHGIEIDRDEHRLCLKNLSAVAAEFGVFLVCWDVRCADATEVRDFDGPMDFVVGNPPYVRHVAAERRSELKESFDSFKSGAGNLFAAFYEIALRTLNENGIVCYITPGSLFTGKSLRPLRERFMTERLLSHVVHCGHCRLFDASTRPVVSVLDRGNIHEFVYYFEYDGEALSRSEAIPYSAFFVDGGYYFEALKSGLAGALSHTGSTGAFKVKEGLQTSANEVFLHAPECGEFTIPVVKASTGGRAAMLFPYKDGAPVEFNDLPDKARGYFEEHKAALESRHLQPETPWFAYGRSQGIADVYTRKYAINALIRDSRDIKLTFCEPGVGVYGGMCVFTDVHEGCLASLLFNERFVDYVRLLGVYKEGGYYTYSGKELERWLDYAYARTASREFTAVSLFCGAGGLDMGFEQAGFKTLWAADIAPDACATRRLWAGSYAPSCTRVHEGDVTQVATEEIPESDVILGGFPCQGFSMAGPRKLDDSRNSLYREYVRIVKAKRPLAFIGENVKGLLTMAGGAVMEAVIEDFSECGYDVFYQLVNAADYGVPQDRERVIIAGFRKDLGVKSFMLPTFNGMRANLHETLSVFGEPDPKDVCSASYSSRFMSRNRKRGWGEVSYTIPAMAKQVPLHPSSPGMEQLSRDVFRFGDSCVTRRLSWRECAAIQTFPPDMDFVGDLDSKYRQIGNAVPVRLARFVAEFIRAALVLRNL